MYFFCSLQGDKTAEEGSRKSYDLNTFPLNAVLWDQPTPSQRFQKSRRWLGIPMAQCSGIPQGNWGTFRESKLRLENRGCGALVRARTWISDTGGSSLQACHVLPFNLCSLLLVLSLSRILRVCLCVCKLESKTDRQRWQTQEIKGMCVTPTFGGV